MLILPALLLALIISAPALWSGFVTGTLDETSALIRFLIAVPVSGAGLALLRSITNGYVETARRQAREAARAARAEKLEKIRQAMQGQTPQHH